MSKLLQEIIRNKLLTGIALDVYTIIWHNKNLSVGEIWKRYSSLNKDVDRSRNEIAKRVYDLETWGAIRSDGTDECEVTGRVVKFYNITGHYPDRSATKKHTKLEPSKEVVEDIAIEAVTKMIEDHSEKTLKDYQEWQTKEAIELFSKYPTLYKLAEELPDAFDFWEHLEEILVRDQKLKDINLYWAIHQTEDLLYARRSDRLDVWSFRKSKIQKITKDIDRATSVLKFLRDLWKVVKS